MVNVNLLKIVLGLSLRYWTWNGTLDSQQQDPASQPQPINHLGRVRMLEQQRSRLRLRCSTKTECHWAASISVAL